MGNIQREVNMSKKKKNELTYFLDHPQIKRHESPGNGNSPGSLADQINWGGKSKTAQPAQPKQPTSSTSSSSSGGVLSTLKGLFKK